MFLCFMVWVCVTVYTCVFTFDFLINVNCDVPGEGRVKMPLSPVASAQYRPFGADIQLAESSLYSSSSSVAHSYSSGSLGQMQFDDTSSNMGSFWTPHRSQMRLQSRRSQSREDLNSSLAEAHLANV